MVLQYAIYAKSHKTNTEVNGDKSITTGMINVDIIITITMIINYNWERQKNQSEKKLQTDLSKFVSGGGSLWSSGIGNLSTVQGTGS